MEVSGSRAPMLLTMGGGNGPQMRYGRLDCMPCDQFLELSLLVLMTPRRDSFKETSSKPPNTYLKKLLLSVARNRWPKTLVRNKNNTCVLTFFVADYASFGDNR